MQEPKVEQRTDSDGQKVVLVDGYPKSGNTWLCRLVAELLEAPVVGFWDVPGDHEEAIEGLDRRSEFRVYKGHQALHQLDRRALSHVLYVVRDVRDVAVSGAHYFDFPPHSTVGRALHAIPLVRRGVRAALRRDRTRSLAEMIRVLERGDARVHRWCARPWDEHVSAFLDAGVYCVRYEDVLAAPHAELRRWLEHIGVERSPAQIDRAIERQSFAAVKRKWLSRGALRRATFLRSGRAGEWRSALSAEQQRFMALRFKATLERLSYPL